MSGYVRSKAPKWLVTTLKNREVSGVYGLSLVLQQESFCRISEQNRRATTFRLISGVLVAYLYSAVKGGIMRIYLFLLVLPVLVLAQDYHDASGQTLPFTLAAGAKTKWDASGISVDKTRPAIPEPVRMSLVPNPSNGNFRISVRNAQGPTVVILYAISGKKVQCIDFTKEKEASLSKALPNGFYVARLSMNGRTVQTARFLVVR
jgi:hypothetical protein